MSSTGPGWLMGPAHSVYVASSWRNEWQEWVVSVLRGEGFVVYDFKSPSASFRWSDIESGWESWTLEEYQAALKTPLASKGYRRDMHHLRDHDAVVMVLPCGKSAHLELGYACGMWKRTAIFVPPGLKVKPELMYKMVGVITDDLNELLRHLNDER